MGQLLLASRLASIDRLVEKTISMDVRPPPVEPEKPSGALLDLAVRASARSPCACTLPLSDDGCQGKNDRLHSNVGAFGRKQNSILIVGRTRIPFGDRWGMTLRSCQICFPVLG